MSELLSDADIAELDRELDCAAPLQKVGAPRDGCTAFEGLAVAAQEAGLASCRLYWGLAATARAGLHLTIKVDGRTVLEPNHRSLSTPLVIDLSTVGGEVRIRIEPGESADSVPEATHFSALLAPTEEGGEQVEAADPGSGIIIPSVRPHDPGPGVMEIRLKTS